MPPDALAKYIATISPFVEAFETTTPFVLPSPAKPRIECTQPRFASFLTGARLDTPRILVDAFVFAYEFQALDERFKTLNGIVDYTVLMESTYTHRRTPKPLFFARQQERYTAVPIIHTVADDTHWHSLPANTGGDDWWIENKQRILVIEKVRQAGLNLHSTDLVLHGDVDEIPDAETLWHLKHCHVKSNVAWPMRFSLEPRIFEKNIHPPTGPTQFPFLFTWSSLALGDLTVQKLRAPASFTPLPHPTGYHLTAFGGPLFQILKTLALAEGGQVPRNEWACLKDLDYVAHLTYGKHERLCCPQDRVV